MDYRSTELYRKFRIPAKELVMKWNRRIIKKSGINEAPQINYEKIRTLEEQLLKHPEISDVKYIKISKGEIDEWENKLGFQKFYDKKNSPRYLPKMLEYMLAFELLKLDEKRDKGFKYIDAASANSPWAMWLRQQYGIMSYSVDLLEPAYNKDYYIKGDVTKMPFENDSIDAISVQSALETFPGNVDIDFIKEAGRILKPRGVLLITPLYLSTEYANCFGKRYYYEREAEEDAKKYIRIGYSGPTTRLYDVPHLIKRLLKTGEESGLKHTLLIFDMDTLMIDKWDKYMYSHFGLMFYKDSKGENL